MKVIFFGLGSVASVMAQCLLELFQTSDKKVEFLFVVRDAAKAKANLCYMRDLKAHSTFLEVKDFEQIFNNPAKYSSYFKDAIACFNTVMPNFNEPILKFALHFGIHYADLASDMFNTQTLKTLRFSQEHFHRDFQKKNTFALINIGISPGVTNFLIGERVMPCTDPSVHKEIKIKNVDLYLLENIRTEQIIFSWAPQVAFDELEEKPRFFRKKQLCTVEPFSHPRKYHFPHFSGNVVEYPLFQEEILSLHQTFPMIDSIHVFAGGNEIELVKNLYQLNLLSKNIQTEGISVEKIVRAAMPGLKTPQQIQKLVKKGIIESAQFSAIAEITLERKTADKKKWQTTTEVTGLSFHRYHELVDTPYRGATYISYPTGVGAAILFFYSYQTWLANAEHMTGIVRSEEMAAIMSEAVFSLIKLELAHYKIDLISHTHAI